MPEADARKLFEMPQRLDASLWTLIAANLIPLGGVFFLGWDAAILVILYWAENVIIGGYNVSPQQSLLVASPYSFRRSRNPSGRTTALLLAFFAESLGQRPALRQPTSPCPSLFLRYGRHERRLYW